MKDHLHGGVGLEDRHLQRQLGFLAQDQLKHRRLPDNSRLKAAVVVDAQNLILFQPVVQHRLAVPDGRLGNLLLNGWREAWLDVGEASTQIPLANRSLSTVSAHCERPYASQDIRPRARAS